MRAIQRADPGLLEEEVTAFLGRANRRSDPTRTTIPAIGTDVGRALSTLSFDRDTEEQFESRLLAAVRQQDQEGC